jgi:hypothetical protein
MVVYRIVVHEVYFQGMSGLASLPKRRKTPGVKSVDFFAAAKHVLVPNFSHDFALA